MAKRNILQDFANYSISEEETNTIKGGRANTQINTGSFGFIDWGDVEIRNTGIVSTIGTANAIGKKTRVF